MRLKINWASFQHVFTKTRLEDVDLSKPQPCNYFVYMLSFNFILGLNFISLCFGVW